MFTYRPVLVTLLLSLKACADTYHDDLEHYDSRGNPILEGLDPQRPRVTAYVQRWVDASLSRRQALVDSTSYEQTITATFVGTDGYTTVPYATNGQQCSTISSNIMAVTDPNGIEYLYMCGGAISGAITYNFQAQNWSACLPVCDYSNNCTGASYNSGNNYGLQNAAGQGRCTFKTDNAGMTFTTSLSNQLQSTRVAGMQKRVYMRSACYHSTVFIECD